MQQKLVRETQEQIIHNSTESTKSDRAKHVLYFNYGHYI